MNKKERKANNKLAEAQKFVANYNKPKPKIIVQPKIEIPLYHEPIFAEEYEIIKCRKGKWEVLYRVKGCNKILHKKCKSKTQAEDWVRKHS